LQARALQEGSKSAHPGLRRRRYRRLGPLGPGPDRSFAGAGGRHPAPRHRQRPRPGPRLGRRLHGRAHRQDPDEPRRERDLDTRSLAAGRRAQPGGERRGRRGRGQGQGEPAPQCRQQLLLPRRRRTHRLGVPRGARLVQLTTGAFVRVINSLAFQTCEKRRDIGSARQTSTSTSLHSTANYHSRIGNSMKPFHDSRRLLIAGHRRPSLVKMNFISHDAFKIPSLYLHLRPSTRSLRDNGK
jgi:hypothetical protein